MTPRYCLLIDDDYEEIEIFQSAAKELPSSITFRYAFGAYEGLDIIGHSPILPDFVFVDINMPKMDGREFLRIIKSDERLVHIPVVIYSTAGDQATRTEMMGLGAHHYIIKPYTVPDLVRALQDFFAAR